MGSVRESADAVEPKAAPAVPAVPAVAAVPGTPSAPALPAAPGTPRAGDRVDVGTSFPAPDGVKQPQSPSQQAATTPPATPKGDGDEVLDVDAPGPSERVTKRQKLEQTQDALLELTNLVKVILEGLSGLHQALTLNTESQRLMKEEVEALAKQMGHDSVTSKFFLSSLTEYQRTLTNVSWQLSGHKKESNVSIKELVMHLEDYSRQISLRLLEAVGSKERAESSACGKHHVSQRDYRSYQVVR